MSYKALDAEDIKLTWGTFRMVRHELGGTAFGLNQIDFPPGKVGPEHDELQSGRKRSTTASPARHADDRRRPGRDAPRPVHPRVADAKRHPEAGADGMSFICVGGVPGGVYEPWVPPEE